VSFVQWCLHLNCIDIVLIFYISLHPGTKFINVNEIFDDSYAGLLKFSPKYQVQVPVLIYLFVKVYLDQEMSK